MPTQTTQKDRAETTPLEQVAAQDGAAATHPSGVAAPAAPVREDVFELIRRDSLDEPQNYVREINVPGGGE